MRRYLQNHFCRTVALVLASFFFLNMTGSFSQAWIKPEDMQKPINFPEIQKSFNEYWKDKKVTKGSGWKVFKRLEWFWEQRLYPYNEIPDANKIYREWQNYNDNKKATDKMQVTADWKFLGPTLKPQQKAGNTPPGIGRINCVAFDPSNSDIIWAGAAFGGVWKSLDGGSTWTTFPQTEFMAVGVSDIAVNPASPNIVYIATGDAESGGFFGQNYSYSIGILKTTNGGSSWVKTSLQSVQSNTLLINRLLISPSNPEILFMASNAGVYKTVDGGANWTQTSSEICRDIEFKSTDPTVLFGAFFANGSYNIKKYTESSGQWTRLLEFNQNEVARVNLATTKANGNYVYAVVAGADGGFHSFWKTSNEGTNWTKVADKAKTPNLLTFDFLGQGTGGQGMYDLAITVDPVTPTTVYVGGINIWKSIDGGSKWTLNAEWTGDAGVPWVHADHHYLTFSPTGVLFSTNDGGIQQSKNGGDSWKDLSNGLAVMQFYRLATSKTDADFIIAGAQDNGTNKLESNIWKNIQGGDGMECIIDYNDPKYVYASFYYGELTKSTDGGATFKTMFDPTRYGEQGGWVTPMVMHPTDPKILFAGLHNIWKTTDRGENWGPISSFSGNGNFRALAVAPSNTAHIYAGAYNQLLHTSNGGTNWSVMYTADVSISYIVVDPVKPDRLWLALSGYKAGSKVMKYENNQWQNISGTLPNIPVNCIVFQNGSPDRLYIGTDVGVFMRDKNSTDWEPFNTGLPPVVINELEIHYGASKLRAATFARGLWETKLSDCNIPPPNILINGKTNLCKGDSVTLECPGDFVIYKWSNGETTKKITVKIAGVFTCKVTDSKQCEANSIPVTVNVSDPPEIVIKSAKNPFCDGDSVQLSGPSLSYSTVNWSNGQTGRKIYVKAPGTYTATGITSEGCTKTSAPFNLTMLPKPAKPTISQNGNQLISSDAVTYQWYVTNEAISGATQKTYTPSKSGKYTVETGDASDCKNISDEFVYGSDDVANQQSIEYIKIQPNPSFGYIEVEVRSSLPGDISLSITNILGIEISSVPARKYSGVYKEHIELGGQSAGVYFIKVKFNTQSIMKSFILN